MWIFSYEFHIYFFDIAIHNSNMLQCRKIEDAVEIAVEECIREGILADFLTRNRAEVVSMSIFEYDKKEEEKKLRKAEFEAGVTEGIQKGLKEGSKKTLESNIREMLLDAVPIHKIKQYTKATDEEIQRIQKKL